MGERKRKSSYREDPVITDLPDVRFADGVDDLTTGERLRDARERQGWELRDVADALRIRYVYLVAIEENRYKDLPGTTYAVGFVRTYAEYLGLDPDPIVRRFKDQLSGEGERPELYFPSPVPEGRVPGGAVLMVAGLLIAGAYGGWYYLSSTGGDPVDLVPPLPDRFSSIVEGGSGTPDADAAGQGTVAVPAAPLPVQPDAVAIAPSAAPPLADPSVTADPGVAVPPADGGDASGATGSDLTSLPQSALPQSALPSSPVQVGSERDGQQVVSGNAEGQGVSDLEPLSGSADPLVTAPVQVAPEEAVPAAPEAADGSSGAGPTALASSEDGGPPSETGDGVVAADPASTEPEQETAAAAPPQPPAVTAPPPVRTYGAPGESRIQLRATQDSWIQVRDGNGDLLITRVLRPGEVYRVPDQPGLRLVTGNAGGLVVTVDGAEAPSMGATGQVLRGVVLEGPRLLNGSAVPN